jgi:hypothetical protein
MFLKLKKWQLFTRITTKKSARGETTRNVKNANGPLSTNQIKRSEVIFKM